MPTEDVGEKPQVSGILPKPIKLWKRNSQTFLYVTCVVTGTCREYWAPSSHYSRVEWLFVVYW